MRRKKGARKEEEGEGKEGQSFWLLPAELGRRGVLGLPLLLDSSLKAHVLCSVEVSSQEKGRCL